MAQAGHPAVPQGARDAGHRHGAGEAQAVPAEDRAAAVAGGAAPLAVGAPHRRRAAVAAGSIVMTPGRAAPYSCRCGATVKAGVRCFLCIDCLGGCQIGETRERFLVYIDGRLAVPCSSSARPCWKVSAALVCITGQKYCCSGTGLALGWRWHTKSHIIAHTLQDLPASLAT